MQRSSYLWQAAVSEAIREVDAAQLTARLAAADDALFYRLLEIEGATANDAERLALEDALEDVRLLRRHIFRFSI